MTSTTLLRVEGVNQAAFIWDTQDLSTIRGGALLLLDVAQQIIQILQECGCSCEPLIEGASIGLFRVQSDSLSAEDIRNRVDSGLAQWLAHATFVVDTLPTNHPSPTDHATLLAQNRWRQMQAPSVVYPAIAGLGNESRVCDIDKVRPAAHEAPGPKVDKRWLSSATHMRRDYGRHEKQSFYAREMSRTGPLPPDLQNLQYTWDFDGLCGNSAKWGNLQDKMAIIYLDGNQFMSTAAQCASEAELAEFSKGVRTEQARILRALIQEKILTDPDWKNGDRVRLETLLWGGDEIIWVVPAWKGWETLRFFFEQCQANATPEWSPNRTRLTYSAGLVFCHKKTPIYTTTRLASALVAQAKQYGRTEGQATDPGPNRLLYQALESFDHVGAVDDTYCPLVLRAELMSTICAAMPEWRKHVSRKKLHQLVVHSVTGKDAPDELRRELARAQNDDATAALRHIEALEQQVGTAVWRHMVELWDYVAPEGREGPT